MLIIKILYSASAYEKVQYQFWFMASGLYNLL
jgi:hypothetical protein